MRTPTINTYSSSGTVVAGARSVAIANTGSASGIIKSVSIGAGVSISFDSPLGDCLDAIAFDATGTTFLITEVR